MQRSDSRSDISSDDSVARTGAGRLYTAEELGMLSSAERDYLDFQLEAPSFRHLDRHESSRFLGFLGALAVAAGLFYLGSKVGDAAEAGKELNEQLKKFNESLDEIKGKISYALERLVSLFDEIEKLIKEIEGYLDRNEVRNAMINTQTSIQVIQSMTATPEMSKLNHDKLLTYTFNIMYDINRVKEFGGMAAVLACAPGFAVWSQTYNLLQAQTPEALVPLWDNPFHLQMRADLQSFFADVRSTSALYMSGSESIPCQGEVPWVYQFDGNQFAKTDILWKDPYEPADGDRSNLFAAPLTHFTPSDPYHSYLVSTTQKAPAWQKKKGTGYWYWDFVEQFNSQFPNPALVTQAKKKFAGLREVSERYSNHLRSFADADYYEEKIIEAMTRGSQ